MQLVACIKFYFLLLGSYILLFALADDSIALDELDTSPNFRSLDIDGVYKFGSSTYAAPTSTIISDSEILTKISVDTASDPTDIVNFLPDVYVGADGGSKLYFGDLQFLTYMITFATKTVGNGRGGFSNRQTVLIGLGTVNANNNFVGRVGNYMVFNDDEIHIASTPVDITVVSTQTLRIGKTDWRPVIIVDDNTTVMITHTYSEMNVWYFTEVINAEKFDVFLKKVEPVGIDGNVRMKVTSSGDTFCLGIVKEVNRGSSDNASRYLQGYFSDGESLWTNPNYAAIALHAQRRTSLIIDLQVTDEETLMTVWREGSKSGIRLKVNAIDATGFKHEIWAIYKERSPIVETTTTALIPETLVHMCNNDRSCPDHYECKKTADDQIRFLAGICDVRYNYVGEGTFFTESHLITYGDESQNSAYDFTRRRRMSSNSRHVPLWFFNQNDEQFAEEVHASMTGYV